MSKRRAERVRLDEPEDEDRGVETRRRVDPPQGGILLVRNGGGRPPGQPNKLPRAIKDAIREAMELHGEDGKGSMGMTGYMLNLIKFRPELFVSLVRRTLPVQLKAEVDPGSLLQKLLQTAEATRAARSGEQQGIGNVLELEASRIRRRFDDPR